MCVLTKPLSNRRDVGGRGVLAAPHGPSSPPPPGVLRAMDASSGEGAPCSRESAETVWRASVRRTAVAAERSPILRRWPSPKGLGKSHTAQFTERCTWWAVRRRSVLCKGRCDASRCHDCRCAALTLLRLAWCAGRVGERLRGGVRGWVRWARWVRLTSTRLKSSRTSFAALVPDHPRWCVRGCRVEHSGESLRGLGGQREWLEGWWATLEVETKARLGLPVALFTDMSS